jgi:hypothetical protein
MTSEIVVAAKLEQKLQAVVKGYDLDPFVVVAVLTHILGDYAAWSVEEGQSEDHMLCLLLGGLREKGEQVLSEHVKTCKKNPCNSGTVLGEYIQKVREMEVVVKKRIGDVQ